MNNFIGNQAPDFTANTVMGDDTIDENFNLKRYVKDHKAILFFYPADFTFVCPSELIAFNNRLKEFEIRSTKIIGVSVDSHFSHLAWKKTDINKGGIKGIKFPLVSDIKKEISVAYNVLNQDGIAFRATFLIDEHFDIRHFVINDLPLGRNIDEAIRMVDALDHHTNHGEVCPAGWRQGQEAMNADSESVSAYLSSNAYNL